MAENRNAQQVREITDKLEQGLKELFESERFKEYLKTMSKFYNYCLLVPLRYFFGVYFLFFALAIQ